MRDIKFRFWDLAIKEMTKFDEVTKDLSDFFFRYEITKAHGNEPVLMQYTGLKDANGREIFEGDLLESHMGNLQVIFKDGGFIAQMEHQPGKFGYHIGGKMFYQVPIIGNLYENPEMVKEN